MSPTPPQDAAVQQQRHRRRANLRLALVLASVALAFAAGFVAKVTLLGG